MILKDASKTQRICSTNASTVKSLRLAIMRIAACVGIVILHTVFAANEYFAEGLTQTEDMLSRIVENNMMWAVPAFIMTTGALQLDPQKTLSFRKLYGRYILRIVIALVSCCLLFRIIDIIMDNEAMSVFGIGYAFVELLTGRSWGHLWYLYLLIGIYILLPFYRMIAEKATDRELRYLCVVYFVFVSLIPMIEAFGLNIAFYISESIIYPLYLFLGHMISKKIIRVNAGTAVLLLGISTSTIIALDVLKYQYQCNLPGELFGYASPAVIIQALALFTLICGNTVSEKADHPWIHSIDGCTFGVYLIHMIFVRWIFRYLQWNPYQNLPIVSFIGIIIGIVFATLFIVWCLKRIPGVKWVL